MKDGIRDEIHNANTALLARKRRCNGATGITAPITKRVAHSRRRALTIGGTTNRGAAIGVHCTANASQHKVVGREKKVAR